MFDVQRFNGYDICTPLWSRNTRNTSVETHKETPVFSLKYADFEKKYKKVRCSPMRQHGGAVVRVEKTQFA
jgi:hypothetical protein